MFPRTRPRPAQSGFSLLELVITMTVMTILVGVVSLRAGSVTDKARAARIVSLVDNIKPAIVLYQDDTGQLPREYNGFQGGTFHRLSQDPSVNGWQGPYIETPINRTWNPTGGQVHLYASAATAVGNAFDLDGNGTVDVANNDACCLSLWNVGENLAEMVDRAYDQDVSANWTDSGRVEYQPASRLLTVLVYSR